MAVLSGCVVPEDMASINERMAMMEQRHLELKQQIKESGKERAQLTTRLDEYSQGREGKDQKLRDQSAELSVILDRLRDEIQGLTGRLEETEYLLKQKITTIEDSDRKRGNKSERVKEITVANRDRIDRLEQYLNFESSKQIGSAKKTVSQAEKEVSEDQMYMLAKQAFDKGDFESAREGFQKLIEKYPKSQHADNAQFWIGEIYYREKWFEKAILEYQKVIENYPKGNKVQASLLKQGFAFFNLGDKANCRLILKELVTKYPKSNEAKIANDKLKGLK